MVLVGTTYAREGGDNGDGSPGKDGWVADARTLEDEGCTKRPGGEDHELGGEDGLRWTRIGVWVEKGVGFELDANCAVVLKQNPHDLVFDKDVQVLVLTIL